MPEHYTKYDNAGEVIKLEVLKLSNEGFSQREIIRITNFSKSKVEEYTKLSKTEIDVLSIRMFKKKYLNFTKDTSIEEQIKSAISFGCTVRDMQKLFHVGNKKIHSIRNNSIKIHRKNKIQIVGEKVKILSAPPPVK